MNMSFAEVSLLVVGVVLVLWATSYVLLPLFQRKATSGSSLRSVTDELQQQKERLLKLLEDLELDNLTAKLAPGEYEREKERLLGQIALCLTELDYGNSVSHESADIHQ